MPRGAPSTIFSSASVKSASCDLLVVAARRGQRRLVGEVGEVGADHAGRRRGDAVEVDVVGERQRARVDLEDLAPAVLVGRRHDTRRSKRPGRSSAESRISGRLVAPSTITATSDSKPSISVRIWLSVCSRSSLPPPKPDAAGARAPDGVELVDEDDRRRGLLGGLEEVAHARGADADDRLDELRRRDREERHPRLARHGLGQQRLAGAGLAREQHAARDPPAELAGSGRGS